MRSIALAAILATCVLVPPSHATLLEINDLNLTDDLTLSNFDLDVETGLQNGDPVLRLLPGGALILTGAADVTFTYLGTEAGHKNLFFSGAQIFDSTVDNASSSPFTAYNVAAGVLDFAFKDSSNILATVTNGSVLDSLNISIALFMEDVGTWLALFNDDCTCDTDFDDMAVRISAVSSGSSNPSPVPIPAALPLLAAGLAGISWMSRRRKQPVN